MLYEEWKSRYKNLKNFNTVLQRCPRFWPLAPPRVMNPGVYSLGISEDPPRYLSSKFDASVRSDCWDISIWKTLTQCDWNGNANADDRDDYNSSPCTSYRRANKNESATFNSQMYPSLWKISNFSTAWVKCHVVAVKCLLICVVHYCVDYIFWSQMRAAYCLVASASSKDPRSGIFATCQNQAVPPCMYITRS